MAHCADICKPLKLFITILVRRRKEIKKTTEFIVLQFWIEQPAQTHIHESQDLTQI